jgi:hypothetical protein
MSTRPTGPVRRLRLRGGPIQVHPLTGGMEEQRPSPGTLSRIVAVTVKEMSLPVGNGLLVSAQRVRCRPSTGLPEGSAVEALLFSN